jgi:hypothetical protein
VKVFRRAKAAPSLKRLTALVLDCFVSIRQNEQLVPLLRIGMTEADVLTEVSGGWKKRQALSGAVWYFESPDIPAQPELDQRGIVIKVSPSAFIVP